CGASRFCVWVGSRKPTLLQSKRPAFTCQSRAPHGFSLDPVKEQTRVAVPQGDCPMLHHVSVGVRDVERAARFYDAALGALGYKRMAEYMPYAIAYGATAPAFWIQLPHDQQTPTPGNGTHIGFAAKNKNAVHKFH